MFRLVLRVFAILFLLGGLLSSTVSAYLFFTPSDEDTLYEQKIKEMNEKYKQAQAARDPAERTRLLNESKEAESSAKVWGEGARARHVWSELGMGFSIVVVLVSFLVVVLTFIIGRKVSTA
jgi:hypothetical protein